MTLLRGQPEPIPPRREQIQATRVQLMMRGIPHAAFYEVVDFAPELGQSQRDLLEAQLADAGILDALVVPRENLEEIRELLQEYPDRFLSPDPPVRDPIASLLPDGDLRFRETVLSCLRGISQSDLQAGTALLPDGRYRCGTIQAVSYTHLDVYKRQEGKGCCEMQQPFFIARWQNLCRKNNLSSHAGIRPAVPRTVSQQAAPPHLPQAVLPRGRPGFSSRSSMPYSLSLIHI